MKGCPRTWAQLLQVTCVAQRKLVAVKGKSCDTDLGGL